MPGKPPGSLRKLLTVTTIVLASLTIASAGALIATTRVLERETAELATTVESVRLLEEAEINLFMHRLATDEVVRSGIEADLRASLELARTFVTSPQEARALVTANERVEALLGMPASAPAGDVQVAMGRAFGALEHLVTINVAQTKAVQARTLAWTRTTNLVGIILGAAIIATTTGLVLWLRRRVLHPLFSLADTVGRFGRGERRVRADVDGPLELQDMSLRFNEMADAIATQREAQNAFLGGIAHDLRTPLSALRLAVDMVDPADPLPPEPQLRRTFAIISRQINHLERMTGDFLDMSKIESGTLDLSFAAHDARAIARGVVDLFEPGARDRVSVVAPPAPVVVRCDEVRLGQAITNLVSNAIKYSPSDAGIELVVSASNSDAVIEVVDHGNGIPKEDQGRIFEPFRRRDTKDSIPGTGLGLFNVKRLVEAHRGRIEVDSTPLQGSTFRILLPLASA
ncbi:MAG TPA: HAMP domain-containing sensor histidine kinase [Kofleriaceae bacterium]|jgi:signal transduction histidine kinase|nr:HAMP domain-containing sensor histidine kinase [Kofleriaceae bacterium]